MKKLFVIFLSLIMVLSAFSTCFAVTTLTVDPFTGEVLNASEDATAFSNTGEVTLTTNVRYDKEQKLYLYLTNNLNNKNVYCSVYNGMVVTEPVTLILESTELTTVYYEGEIYEVPEDNIVSDPGVYIVRNVESDTELFRFTIVNPVTCMLYSYTIPSLFYLVSVTKDGVDIGASDGTILLEDDGIYKIIYAIDKINKTYELDLTIDHTPPSLIISGVNEKGYASSTVTFGETEENSTMVIQRDEEYIALSSQLKTAGDYIVEYSDEAGNTVEYQFTIRFFFDGGAWIYVAMLAMVLGAAAFYYFWSKKNFRTC